MRTIKFRLWDKKQKEMRTMQPNWFFLNLNASEYYDALQFTGLLDKNGKEIYEGDIVKVIIPVSKTHICKIIWSDFNASFSCNALDNTLFISASGNLKREGEVIGNIYENPELLKT